MTTTYVKFTDTTTGGLIDGSGTTGWTLVDDPNFDQTLAANIAEANADGGSPDVAVPLDPSGISAQVQQALLNGNEITAEFAVYDDQGRLTQDYALPAPALFSDVADMNSSLSSETLDIGFATYQLTSTSYDPASGAANPPITKTYRFGAGHTFLPPAVATAPATSAGLSTAASADSELSNGSTDYYVLLTDSSGQLLPGTPNILLNALPNADSGYVSEAESIVYSLARTPNTAGVSPSASVSIAFRASSKDPQLFSMLAQGAALKQVEIIAACPNGTIKSDTIFNDVAITSQSNLTSAGTPSVVYDLQDLGGYSTTHYSASGKASTGEATWTTTLPISTEPISANLDPAEVSSNAFLTFPSTAGAVSAAIASVQFSVANDPNFDFSSLTVTFDQEPSADVLDAIAALGSHGSLLLQLYKQAGLGYSTFLVYERSQFSGVSLTGAPIVTNNGDGSSSYTYTFAFDGLKETYQNQKPDGTLRSINFAGWDQANILGQNGGSTATIQSPAPAPTAPIAQPDQYSVLENQTLTVSASGVLANDLDLSNGSLELSVAKGPADGALTLNQDGSFTYQPDAGFIGTDSFEYVLTDNAVTDATLKSSLTTVTIDVEDPNAPPAGIGEYVATPEGTPVAITQFNFTDAGGHALKAVEITSLPGEGTLTDNGQAVAAGQFVSAADIANGLLVYSPEAGLAGDDEFTFQVQDDGGANGRSDIDPTPRTVTLDVQSPDGTQAPDTTPALAIGAESFATPGMTLYAGQTVTFSIDFGAPVTVVDSGLGAPALALNNGAKAVFTGSAGDDLTFAYTVQPGDEAADLEATHFNLPAGTTIQNDGGQVADLTDFTVINTNVKVDGLPPTIVHEAATPDNGADLSAGRRSPSASPSVTRCRSRREATTTRPSASTMARRPSTRASPAPRSTSPMSCNRRTYRRI